jgi:hypothetical protein
MNLPPAMFADVTCNQGAYLAQLQGGIGFDVFLGKPQPIHDGPGLDNTLRVWRSLSGQERHSVVNAALARKVRLADFIPETEFDNEF